jgi:hypothetical protein
MAILNHITENKVYLGLSALLTALVVFIWWRNEMPKDNLRLYQITDEVNPIWNNYLHSQPSILIVVGDHFFQGL